MVDIVKANGFSGYNNHGNDTELGNQSHIEKLLQRSLGTCALLVYKKACDGALHGYVQEAEEDNERGNEIINAEIRLTKKTERQA